MNRLRTSISRIAAALSAVVVCTACAATRGATTAPAPSPSLELKVRHGDSVAIAKAQADSARIPYTAADVHFMSGMIGHHAQAIVMAKMAPTHGASPSVQRLSERIINAQQDEIVIMQQWLADRRQPVPEANPAGMKMTMGGGGQDHMHLMPGMLTAAQMKELDQARGREFDRLFLKYMIQHHRGAVEMVSTLFNTNGAGQEDVVFKFASDVNTDQSTEIARMESMLAALTP